MKQFLLFVLLLAAIAGLYHLIDRNWYEISQLKLPQSNIRIPSFGD